MTCGVLLASGCSKYPALTARYAHAEEEAATEVIPLGDLAFRLCRKEAEYRFLGQLLGSQAKEAVTGETWSSWYGQATARPGPDGRAVTWQAQCREWANAGDVVALVLRALRAHGRALAALAEAKDFDAGGLATAGDAIGTAGGKLGASSVFSSDASKAGNAFSSATAAFVNFYRERKLKDAVANSDPCMQGTFDHLRGIGKTLADTLQHTEEGHAEVVLYLRKYHGDPSFAKVIALGDAFDLVGNDDVELQRIRRVLTTYRVAIDQLAISHHGLAALADAHASDAAVERALSDLESTTESLLELER